MATATQEIGKLRRVYFACTKRLGMDSDTRHAFNLSITDGRVESSTRFQLSDWRNAVAELQRQCGMDVDAGRPRIKRVADDTEAGDQATGRQVSLIEQLAQRIHWRRTGDWRDDLGQWIRRRMLQAMPARAANWSGKLEELPRDVASKLILGLQRMGAPIHG